MVQLEKVQGQKGHMVLHEDGTIIASSGDLANSESTANKIISLQHSLHSLQVNSIGGTGVAAAAAGDNQGAAANNGQQSTVNGSSLPAGQVWKWNRITVDFGDHSYVTCVSNKKIHVVKRDNVSQDADHTNG